MAVLSLTPSKFFQEASAAVLDFGSYLKVFQQPLRRSLVYLLYLAVLSSLVITLVYSLRLVPRIDDFLSWARTTFPSFVVTDGQMSMETDSPITLVYPGSQLFTFVFDTRPDHIQPESVDQPAVVFTRDKLYLSFLGVTWDWPQIEALFANTEQGIVVSPEILEEARKSLGWMAPAFFFFTLGVSLVGKLIQALLLTFFSISASTAQGIRLPYPNTLTIAIYALTPAIAIDLLVVVLGQTSDLFQIIYLITAALYTYLATRRCVTLE